MKSKLFLLSMLVVLVGACGGRKGGTDTPGGDTDNASGDSDPIFCTSGDQCRSGVCEGGQCVDATTCSDHSECPAGQYCHFPTTPAPWEGACEGPCTGENSCGIVGQECHEYQDYRRCYTNLECNPANNSTDCPPGEVCWQDSRTCKWPPDTCYFAEQCPLTADGTRWVCDPATGECIDPTAVGECDDASDCEGRPGCAAGCVCRDGVCEVAGSCDPTPDGDAACGTGNYCAGGVCQPATPCNSSAADGGHPTCLPYSLVCRNNYCGNPEPCGQPNNTCDDGWECNLNYKPPVCFPEGAPGCTRHDQCPSDMYCDSLDAQCKTGCRDNASCDGQCGAGGDPMCVDGVTPCPNGDVDCGGIPGMCQSGTSACYCQNNHTCGPNPPTGQGGTCGGNEDCAGGMVCAYPSSADTFTCDTLGIGNCTTSCRQACDLLVSAILDPCPQGEKCGGGGTLEPALMLLIQQLMGASSSSASVCYPET